MLISGLKDIDREVLKWIDDKDLLKVCTINRKTWYEVCDDNFLKRRLNKYPGIEKYKNENESWKRFFLRFVYYTALMRKQYKFEYTEGNFETQYKLLKMKMDNDSLFLNATEQREFSLAKHAIKLGADIHYDNDGSLCYASRSGCLDVVKWLLENGLDIHAENDLPVGWASQQGHLDVVKFLVDKGTDIHTDTEYALREASKEGHLDVVKFLVEQGADIHAFNNDALVAASCNGHTDIVKYLLEQGTDIHNQKALKYAEERGHTEIIKLLKN